MTRKLLVALILIGLTVVLIVMQKGSMDLNLLVTKVEWLTSLTLLGFTAVGVVIGILIK